MGGLISGIAGLVEGNPTSTEQGELGGLGTTETSTGTTATNAAQGYYGGILSGNPEEIAQTLAPEISSGATQVQQNANANAQFGNRSGGTNSSTQAAQSNERGNIINLTGQLQQGAAAGEAGLGTNLLSQASTNINDQAGLAKQAQQTQLSEIGQVANGAGEIAAAPFTGGASLGTGGLSLPGFGGSTPPDLRSPPG